MYTIIELPNGTYRCKGRLQDGTERWERWNESTLDAAIKSMKKFAKVLNGVKIKKRDITYLRPEMVVTPKYMKYVEYDPFA